MLTNHAGSLALAPNRNRTVQSTLLDAKLISIDIFLWSTLSGGVVYLIVELYILDELIRWEFRIGREKQ